MSEKEAQNVKEAEGAQEAQRAQKTEFEKIFEKTKKIYETYYPDSDKDLNTLKDLNDIIVNLLFEMNINLKDENKEKYELNLGLYNNIKEKYTELHNIRNLKLLSIKRIIESSSELI